MTLRFLFVFLVFSTAAPGMIWQSGVESLESEHKGEMKQTGKLLYSPLRVLGGSCVAIGDEWVLTSRHGTKKWSAQQLRVTFPGLGKKVYQVEEILLPEKGDVALLRLDKKVRGAKDLTIHPGKDEVGKRVWMGGFGFSGPVDKPDGRGVFYSGHNRVDKLRDGKLSITFDKPGAAAAEQDEAMLSMMDSGSPMFVETSNGWELAGIASTVSDRFKPRYGHRGNYARLSVLREWIRKQTS